MEEGVTTEGRIASPGEENPPRRDSNPNIDSDRVIVTKRAVFRALVELMDEKDFSKIGVGDILERAGVSRSTFYRCFSDKYDVINWSFNQYKNLHPEDRAAYGQFEPSLRVLLKHMAAYRRYYAQALRYLGQNSLRDYIFETSAEYMRQCWREAHGQEELGFKEACVIRFAAAGMSKIIEAWVLEGCAEPVDEVADVIVSLAPPELLATLY